RRAAELSDEDAREPDASVVEERDPHAVRILTVHAAKGLEFAAVFVPECGAPPLVVPAALQLDAELGAALRVRGADGKPRWGRRGGEVDRRRKERELAASRRLVYVAATRARDPLVFSARPARGDDCWRGFLDRLVAAPRGGGPRPAARRLTRATRSKRRPRVPPGCARWPTGCSSASPSRSRPPRVFRRCATSPATRATTPTAPRSAR